MRVYLPLTVSDLQLDFPPDDAQFPPQIFHTPPDVSGDALEELEEAALHDCAFSALEKVFADDSTPPVRIVAVSAVEPETWDQVESFQVDSAATGELISAARVATTQAELDDFTQMIFDADLEWYDGSELSALRKLS